MGIIKVNHHMEEVGSDRSDTYGSCKFKRMLMLMGVSVFCMGMVTGCGAVQENGLNRTNDTKDVTNMETEPDTERGEVSALSGLVSQENGIPAEMPEDMEGESEEYFPCDWENSTCKYKEDLTRWDDDYEGEDIETTYLTQYDHQGNKLQEFSYCEFGMKDELGIEILTVRDNELLFSYDGSYEDDGYDIYSVPVEHEGGKETLAFDRISMVCKEVPSEVYIYGDDNYLVFENGNSIVEVRRAEKNYRKIRADVKGLTLFTQQMDEEKKVIYFGGSSKEGYQGLFAYVVGSGTIRQVTSQDCMSTLFAMGEGKLFYMVVCSENGRLCYDLFQYDNATGENTTLATEAQIVGKIPTAPTEGSDMVREIRYRDGKLYIEVWAKQETYVLCCDVASRDLTVAKGIKCLVEHTESKLDEPLHNADANYGNANDHNIFISSSMPDGSIGLREYTLQGEFVRNVYTHYCGKVWNLLYVNNDEMFFGVGIEEQDIYSVPLRRMEGNDFPVMSEAKRVCKISGYGDFIAQGNFYADADYLVYVTNCHEAIVYDRHEGKRVKINNMPQINFYFATDAQKVARNMVGDCFVYCTKPYGKNEYKYAFSYWRLGDDKLTIMDKRCHTAASRVCDSARNQVIYQLGDGIWCYDIKNDKRRKLLDEKDIDAFYKKNRKKAFCLDLFVDRDLLYLVDTVSGSCGSFDLEKGGEIRYEEKFAEMLKEDGEYHVDEIWQAEGKFLITMTAEDELPSRYRYYDPQTAVGRELSPNDKEMLYFWLH